MRPSASALALVAALAAIGTVCGQTVIPQKVALPQGFRITCYDGYELIYTNDKYAADGITVTADQYPYPVGQCRLCPKGTATMDGFRCSPCPAGYFSDAGARECTACPTGTITIPKTPVLTADVTYEQVQKLNQGPQASVCISCPAGYFQPNLAGTVCLPCPSGFTSTTGSTSCTPCNEGTFHGDGAGLASVYATLGLSGIAQVVGNEAAASEITAVNPVVDGYAYAAVPNTCIMCPKNTYQPLKAQAATSKDATGNLAFSACRRCEDGWWAAPGSAFCSACPAGSYRNSYFDGSAARANSAGLSFNTANEFTSVTDTGSACYKCPKGTYAPNPGSSVCQPCPAGTAATSTGSTACAQCAPGTNSLVGDRTLQLSHAAAAVPVTGYKTYTISGYDNADGMWKMLRNGTDAYFWLAAKADACAPNLPGFYTDVPGLGIQLPCRPGTFLAPGASDKTLCITCDLGTFNEDFTQPTCKACWKGSFASERGMTKCEITLPGTFTNPTTPATNATYDISGTTTTVPSIYEPGQSAPTPCSLGYYQPDGQQDRCIKCATGSYADVTGLPTCKLCQAGRHQDGVGQPQCKQCLPGQFSDYGAVFCSLCPAGSITSKSGTSRCATCAKGFYANLPLGASACQACPRGYYGPFAAAYSADGISPEGPRGCYRCGVDTFTDRPGMDTCSACPKLNVGGSTLVDQCTESDGAQRCKPCDLLITPKADR
ncbi:Signal peptide, CUB and EGF-like domain-containing protein 2 [Tetrabaena socialis]|uniref:Signal peptide, CUB and EGF-like domain-containing protein 2 n=1 Tax=Tetrabaena socialis TaxID=47790 RepID=A0A2J7ZQI4_9CHLO|nr:Signal peptide, CUB and EGF-like domain-containing protein 2 [Tetrabaena socialis]|eukprot:PNH02529.1 Signal peptide, CUB and EGF-like domain-containing protein 2 [Tetrabaena socialis]